MSNVYHIDHYDAKCYVFDMTLDQLSCVEKTLCEREKERSFNPTKVLVGSWLFCLHKFPCSVSFWCMFWMQCGKLNEKRSILVQ